MTDIDEFFNLSTPEPKPLLDSEVKTSGRPKKEVLIGMKILINGEEFEIGNRLRMKETINRMKESQLVEIIGVNKNGEIHVQSVYDHSKLYVTQDQLYSD